MYKCLQMGCLSSRSTVNPNDELAHKNVNNKLDSRQNMSRKAPNSNLAKVNNNIKQRQQVSSNHMNDSITLVKQAQSDSISDGDEHVNKATKTLEKKMEQPNNSNFDINKSDQLSVATADDDIMAILMNDHERLTTNSNAGDHGNNDVNTTAKTSIDNSNNTRDSLTRNQEAAKDDGARIDRKNDSYKAPLSSDKFSKLSNSHLAVNNDTDNDTGHKQAEDDDDEEMNSISNNEDSALVKIDHQRQVNNESTDNEISFDDELSLDLLRQFIMIDYEITQLENKDALRMYHEKIEQLEQLESELDMISAEAEKVAARGGGSSNSTGNNGDIYTMMPNNMGNEFNYKTAGDNESNSMLSGVTESLSRKSSFNRISNNNNQSRPHTRNDNELTVAKGRNSAMDYSTIEEVFDRKIVLEKERDRLKKQVEMIIIECDKLQNRYKRRDQILDQLFDGRTGNVYENNLEIQLKWIMEQKHYVDNVYYAWKRAETLTNQTCEQFAKAMELLKKLSTVEDKPQRIELANDIGKLLAKSRQDIEQAQEYNPNVEAPFFSKAETERFDNVIQTICSPKSINQIDYNQVASVIQFALQRAINIRAWLDQILQITIARDSFELAEEFKWIAIQLRKERISLIKSRLHDEPYHSMMRSVHQEMDRQQQIQLRQQQHRNQMRHHQQEQQLQLEHQQLLAITDGHSKIGRNKTSGEVNRDSGIESDDIDIEEEIYRLLELNKDRFEFTAGDSGSSGASRLRPMGASKHKQQIPGKRVGDKMMQERIASRVRGERALAILSQSPPGPTVTGSLSSIDDGNGADTNVNNSTLNSSAATTVSTMNENGQASTTGGNVHGTPSKLRVELDEDARQNLLKQVNRIHEQHRNKMEQIRWSNRAKASDVIKNRVQQARRQQIQDQARQQQQQGSDSQPQRPEPQQDKAFELLAKWDGLV